MNTAEILAALRAKAPEAVQGLTDTAVKKLIGAVLGVVRDGVAEADQGRVAVSGLGRFNVKLGAKEVDGQKQERRKVVFQPATKAVGATTTREAKMEARKTAKDEQKSERKAAKKASKAG